RRDYRPHRSPPQQPGRRATDPTTRVRTSVAVLTVVDHRTGRVRRERSVEADEIARTSVAARGDDHGIQLPGTHLPRTSSSRALAAALVGSLVTVTVSHTGTTPASSTNRARSVFTENDWGISATPRPKVTSS